MSFPPISDARSCFHAMPDLLASTRAELDKIATADFTEKELIPTSLLEEEQKYEDAGEVNEQPLNDSPQLLETLINQLSKTLLLPAQTDLQKLEYNSALGILYRTLKSYHNNLIQNSLELQEHPEINQMLIQILLRDISTQEDLSLYLKLFELGKKLHLFSEEALLEIQWSMIKGCKQYPSEQQNLLTTCIHTPQLTQKEAIVLLAALQEARDISTISFLNLLKALEPHLQNTPQYQVLLDYALRILYTGMQEAVALENALPEEFAFHFLAHFYFWLQTINSNQGAVNKQDIQVYMNVWRTLHNFYNIFSYPSSALHALANTPEHQAIINQGLILLNKDLGKIIKKEKDFDSPRVLQELQVTNVKWLNFFYIFSDLLKDENLTKKLLENFSKCSKLFSANEDLEPCLIHFLIYFLNHPDYQGSDQICEICLTYLDHLSQFSNDQLHTFLHLVKRLIDQAEQNGLPEIPAKGKKKAKNFKQQQPEPKQFKPHKNLSRLYKEITQEYLKRVSIFKEQKVDDINKALEKGKDCLDQQFYRLVKPLIVHLFQPTQDEFRKRAELVIEVHKSFIEPSNLIPKLCSLLEEKNEHLSTEKAVLFLRACANKFPIFLRKQFPSFPLQGKGKQLLNEEELFLIALPLIHHAMRSQNPESLEWVEGYFRHIEPQWWYQKYKIDLPNIDEERLLVLFNCLDHKLDHKILNNVIYALKNNYQNPKNNWLETCFHQIIKLLPHLEQLEQIDTRNLLQILDTNFKLLEKQPQEVQEAFQEDAFYFANAVSPFVSPYKKISYDILIPVSHRALNHIQDREKLQQLSANYMEWVLDILESEFDDEMYINFVCEIFHKLYQNKLLTPKAHGRLFGRLFTQLVDLLLERDETPQAEALNRDYQRLLPIYQQANGVEWVRLLDLEDRYLVFERLICLPDRISCLTLLDLFPILFADLDHKSLLSIKCRLAGRIFGLHERLMTQQETYRDVLDNFHHFFHLLLIKEFPFAHQEGNRENIQTLFDFYMDTSLRDPIEKDLNMIKMILTAYFEEYSLIEEESFKKMTQWLIQQYDPENSEPYDFLIDYVSRKTSFHLFFQEVLKEAKKNKRHFRLLVNAFVAASKQHTLLSEDLESSKKLEDYFEKIFQHTHYHYFNLPKKPPENKASNILSYFETVVQAVLVHSIANNILCHKIHQKWIFDIDSEAAEILVFFFEQFQEKNFLSPDMRAAFISFFDAFLQPSQEKYEERRIELRARVDAVLANFPPLLQIEEGKVDGDGT